MFTHSVMSDFATPWTVACQAPLPMGFSRQESGVGCHALLQGIFPTQGLNPSLQADSLPPEPPRKPKNTGVGDLSLLQGFLSTQESNWGLLYCRRILYQLSYQGACGNTTHILVPMCLNSQSSLFLIHALIQQVFTENLLCVKGLFLELGR